MKFSCNPGTFFLMGFDQSAANRGQSFLGQLSIGDIQARSNIAGKTAARVESRHADIQDPAVLSIVTPESIFHRKRLPLIKRLRVGFQAALQILLVYSVRPAVSQFCLEPSAGELHPWLVEVVAQLVTSSHPDHYRGCIGNKSKALFTFTNYIRSLLMLLGESCKNHERYRSENQEHL